MFRAEQTHKYDLGIIIPVIFLTTVGIFILNSLSYLTISYMVFVCIALALYFLFSHMDFEVLTFFSKYFYIGSVIFLILPIIIGQATRGTIRWIPIGSFTLQPAELVRPFLFIFLADYMVRGKKDFYHLIKSLFLFFIPTFLIFIQPSLGVTLITSLGFVGIFLFSSFSKKSYIYLLMLGLIAAPLLFGVLTDYQKQRFLGFASPHSDSLGIGYNSLQSMISVGSGGLFGRGLGRGIGTQLAFLPERHSDFIFASLSEELGFVGALLTISVTFYLFFRILRTIDKSQNTIARAYVAGIFLSMFAQFAIHVGMNMNLLPITGVPYPLLSAGGSSLIATMISLGIVSSIKTST